MSVSEVLEIIKVKGVKVGDYSTQRFASWTKPVFYIKGARSILPELKELGSRCGSEDDRS